MSNSYCPEFRVTDWTERETDSSRLDWYGGTKRRAQAKWQLADEFIVRAIAAAAVVEIDETLAEKKFRELAERWEEETSSLSSVTKRVMNRHYQAIIGMGSTVVPFLIRDLQTHRRDWFWALSAITQENPIDRADAGRVDAMTLAWVRWAKKKALL